MKNIQKKDKNATIEDVAKAANVSITTVSRVLNKNYKMVNVNTAKRVLKVIEELDYHPNAMARGLHSKTTKTIGLIVQDISNPYYHKFIQSVECNAQELGYTIILASAQRSREQAIKYFNIMREKRVDGFIIIGGGVIEDSDERNPFNKGNLPIVVIGKPYSSRLSSVQLDNVMAAKQVCGFLIELGHRRIATITGGISSITSAERTQGYEEALKEYGIDYKKEYIIEGNFELESGFCAINKISKIGGVNGITAIFAQNDLMAIGAMKALQKKGFCVPKDISIIGFDNIQATSFVTPALTTVEIPYEEMGRIAISNLNDIINGNEYRKTVYLHARIKARDSHSHFKND